MFLPPVSSSSLYQAFNLPVIQSTLPMSIDFYSGGQLTFAFKDHLEIKQGFDLNAQVRFLGIYCDVFETSWENIEEASLNLIMPNFSSGFGNIQVTVGTNVQIFASIQLLEESVGVIYGKIAAIGMEEQTEIYMDNSLLGFSITGTPFDGIFSFSFGCEAEFPKNWNEAIWTFTGTISTDSLISFSEDVRTRIIVWI